MTTSEVCFWFALGCVAYTYLLYPALIGAMAALRPRLLERTGAFVGTVSVVIAAKNEDAAIATRLENLRECLKGRESTSEVIVVSDGSSDRTVEMARAAGGQLVRVIELAESHGKAAALNEGCAAAHGDVVVFADTRQTWARDSLDLLLENFTDPKVGAASGHLVIESARGVLAGVGLYWRFERWLRTAEGRIGSVVGATGAISAVWRRLFSPLPPGTLLDDVYWPLRVAMQGFRVIHDERAMAYDRLPNKASAEFRRKVRTLSGNFQLIARLPSVILPWRNPIWWQFLSHKVMRLAVPWALLMMFVSSVFGRGILARAALAAQVALCVVALLGLTHTVGSRSRLASAAGSFLVLNAAAFVAFWVFISGRASGSWNRTAYHTAAPRVPAVS